MPDMKGGPFLNALVFMLNMLKLLKKASYSN